MKKHGETTGLDVPKFQYHVLTWGGFYNKEHYLKHGLSEGDYVFDTSEERSEFCLGRVKISKDLRAEVLMFSYTEGFNCNVRTVLNRVVEHGGKQYYSQYDIGVNYPFHVAKYHMENKWFPGCNSYPLGHDFDYENRAEEITTVKEWITGAWQELEEMS